MRSVVITRPGGQQSLPGPPLISFLGNGAAQREDLLAG